MKADLAPKYSYKLDENYLLWFEKSNNYVIVSELLKVILETFIKAKSRDECVKTLSSIPKLNTQNINSLVKEASDFLNEANTTEKLTIEDHLKFTITKPHISKTYAIGEHHILVNYGSEILESLIHPLFDHLTINSVTTTAVVFDLFQYKNRLLIYKDQLFLKSFETKKFNYLQGRFTLEIANVLYKKTEQDWLATFHASTVSNKNKAIMIVGDSGNGKSTLTALLMAQGFDMLADDVTPMLAETQEVYRNPSAISVKEGAFNILEDEFPHFNELKIHANGQKKVLVKYLASSNPFHEMKPSFPCNTVVLVNYSKDSKSTINKVSGEQILKTLIPDSWISPKPEHSKKFIDWLTNVRFYQLNYSDNAYAINEFKVLFDS
ncbi:hypothetical protein [uncultured Psychroserpens sp.]|uniref:hypothetical protein n=1 Tax=uncultured Psychroserpens sp. TaxID=255436 RepID=UPI0026088139|nr:hypothetical protein [uncultured Psychroserpens sp.]